MTYPVTGVILAGGKSVRMGREKALLEVGSKPLLQRAVDSISSLFQEVVIVSYKHFPIDGARFVPDQVQGKGPLGGIHAGLIASNNPAIFALACDMPFANSNLIRYILDQAGGYEVVVPFVDGEYEPTHAYYSKNCLGPIEVALADERPRIVQFYPEVRVRKVVRAEIERFGDPARIFFNTNTPHELRRAEALEEGKDGQE